MARRRRRNSDDNEQGLVWELVDLALVSPKAGFICAGVVLVLGIILMGAFPKNMQSVGVILGLFVWVIAGIVAMASLIGLLRRRSPAKTSVPPPLQVLPYRKMKSLLSPGEYAFYHPLLDAVDGRCAVFAKTRLVDLVRIPKETPNWRAWFQRVSQKHVDFVLCDLATTAPLLVIELDDLSHKVEARKERDEFVDQVLHTAGLPILHFKCQQAYDVELLRAKVTPFMPAII